MESVPFFTWYFELFTGITDNLEEIREGLHPVTSLTILIISFVFPIIYYFVVSSPKWLNKRSWVTQMLLSAILAFGIAYYQGNDFLYAYQDEIDTGFLVKYGLAASLFVILANTLLSYVFKNFSKNAGHLPT